MFKYTIEIVSLVIAVLCWVHYFFYSKDGKQVFLFFSGAIFLGTVAEIVAIVTTSSYNYPGFRWYIGPVPVFVSLGWGTIFYTSYMVGKQLSLPFVNNNGYILYLGLLSGSCGMLADLYYDPVAVILDWWVWENGSFYYNVPIANFAGWFILCGGFSIAYTLVFRKSNWLFLKKIGIFYLYSLIVLATTTILLYPFLK